MVRTSATGVDVDALPGWDVRRAHRATARARGLLGRRGLGPREGLWLRPARAVHTLGMRFPVDLVWLDAAGRVVRLDEGVRPWRHRACRAATGGVVELAAGRGAALVADLGP